MKYQKYILAGVFLQVMLTAGSISAQTATDDVATDRPFGIADNSFLVEEAFNQEPGIFQNISNFVFQRDQWVATFTQEWPAPNMAHQLSYTIPFGFNNGMAIGDVLLNYRYQLLEEGPGRPAFSPRVSLSVPSGTSGRELTSDAVGWQLAMPISKRSGNLYIHANAGFSHVPRAKPDGNVSSRRESLFTPLVAGSVIWQSSETFNLMLEMVGLSIHEFDAGTRARSNQVIVSPGFRKALNYSETQVVVGIALPATFSSGDTDLGVLTYFSYETRFKN